MKAQKITIAAVLSFLMASLVSAYNGYGYSNWGSDFWYNIQPSTLLQNEWVVFGGIFALTFAVVYYSVSRFMVRQKYQTPLQSLSGEAPQETSKGPAVVISLVIAFFVASAFSQRAALYGYMGQELTNWILFIAFAIVVVFALNMSLKSESPVMNTILTIIITLALLGYVNFLPIQISNYFEGFFSFLIGPLGFIFAILIWAAGLWLLYKILRFFFWGRVIRGASHVKKKVGVGLWRARGKPVFMDGKQVG